MPPVMPAIGENPSSFLASLSNPSAASKPAVASFSSEFAKATGAAQSSAPRSASAQTPSQSVTSVKTENRKAPAESERPRADPSTSTGPRQGQAAEAQPSPVPVPTVIPVTALQHGASDTDTSSSTSSSDDSAKTQIGDSSSLATLSLNALGSLPSSLPGTSALGISDSAPTPVSANADGIATDGTPSADTTPDAKLGDAEEMSGSSGATQSASLKPATAEASPAQAISSSEAAVWKQPRLAADSPAAANHAAKVSQSPIDNARIESPKIDGTKIEDAKIEGARIDGSLKDAAKVEAPKSEAVKADARSTSLEQASSDRGKGSASTGDGKTEHGSQHDTSTPTTSGLISDAKGLESPTSPNGFTSALVGQTSAADISKAATASAASAAPSANATSSLTASNLPATDRPDPTAAADPSSVAQSALQTAKLVERAGQSELHVGFQAGELGSVDIRTSMIHNQLSAEISVEHSALRNLLATELPHLQEKLAAAHQITTSNLILNNQSGGTSADSRQAYRQLANAPQRSVSQQDQSKALPGNISIPESSLPSAQLDIHM